MSTDNYTVPGWNDLLAPSTRMDKRDDEYLHRAEMAASNVMDAVLNGMAAVGDIQWRAALQPDWDNDGQTSFALGVLQESLIDLVAWLRTIESNAIFAKHERELAEARKAAA